VYVFVNSGIYFPSIMYHCRHCHRHCGRHHCPRCLKSQHVHRVSYVKEEPVAVNGMGVDTSYDPIIV